MPSSDRSSSGGDRDSRSPRFRRPRSRSRSRNRKDSRDRSLSPDSFGPKLPKPRNREREREDRERRFREARNLRRFRIESPNRGRSRSRSRSRSRERHNNHWPEQRDGAGKQGGFKDDYYYDQQRDDAQRQRQEAFIARYNLKQKREHSKREGITLSHIRSIVLFPCLLRALWWFQRCVSVFKLPFVMLGTIMADWSSYVNPSFEALSFVFLLQAAAREGEDWRAGLSWSVGILTSPERTGVGQESLLWRNIILWNRPALNLLKLSLCIHISAYLCPTAQMNLHRWKEIRKTILQNRVQKVFLQPLYVN